MITDSMPCSILLFHESRIGSDQTPNAKKSGLYIVLLKNGEYLRRVVRIWAIVKGQCNFRQGGITVIKKTVLRPQKRYCLRQRRGQCPHRRRTGEQEMS